MYSALKAHIERFIDLEAEEWEALAAVVDYREVKKKDFLLKPGQICTSNHFIVKGCFRCYFINRKENEHIVQFGIENWWITDYDSLYNRKPTHHYIQAIEDSEIITLNQPAFEELLKKAPGLERYFRIILQKVCSAAQRRVEYIFNYSVEERYHQFNDGFPEFVQRVPQYMLASYLGFTPEFLSKIRAKRQ